MVKHRFFPWILLGYHLMVACFAYFYILKEGGDATRYWWLGMSMEDKSWIQVVGPGTDFVKSLTYPLVKYLKMPFWMGFIFFSLYSYIGWYYALKIVKDKLKYNKGLQKIIILLFFLPNQHFWTSVIGKEALLFTPTIWIIYCIINDQWRHWACWVALGLLILVRPHMGGIIAVGLMIYILYNWKINIRKKLLITLVSLLAGGNIIIYILNKILVGQDSVINGISRYYKAYNEVLKQTTAYVPLEKYSLMGKLGTFFFRPLWELGDNLWWSIVGLENCIWLFLFIIGGLMMIKYRFKIDINEKVVALWLIGMGMTLMYVYAYANFGLIIRTKVLILPWLLIALVLIKKQKIS